MAETETVAPPLLVSQIETSDQPFHTHLVQQLRAAHEAMASAQAAQRSWSVFLTKKYELQEKDIVTAEGAITRVKVDA